jgi:hypothetical protein
MKLSEAIREGIKKDGVQIFGHLWQFEGEIETNLWGNSNPTYDLRKNLTGCCTIGAALLGVERPRADPWEVFPILKEITDCPKSCDVVMNAFGAIIVHLNDNHKWTREEIADWLEGIGK